MNPALELHGWRYSGFQGFAEATRWDWHGCTSLGGVRFGFARGWGGLSYFRRLYEEVGVFKANRGLGYGFVWGRDTALFAVSYWNCRNCGRLGGS
jgi:hypothetical protein